MRHVHICTFSALDDVPRSHWNSPAKLLRALASAGRFSCFEIPETGRGAKTITWLLNDSGWIARTWGEYPWTYVELSGAGRRTVEEAGDA